MWGMLASLIGGGLGGLLHNQQSPGQWSPMMPGLQEQIDRMRGMGDWAYGQKSRGSKYANWFLGNMMGKNGGDPSAILNMSPFKAQDASEDALANRDIAMQTALEANPYLTQRAQSYASAQRGQNRAIRDENWLSSETNSMAGLSESSKRARVGDKMNAENQALSAFLQGHVYDGDKQPTTPWWQAAGAGALDAYRTRKA